MNDLKKRLVGCFALVFPDLPEAEIPSAAQSNLPAWDSVAAITLVNVLEDEFNIHLDFDILADLDSFDKVLAYLETEVPAA
jgi:acyl carrier protein